MKKFILESPITLKNGDVVSEIEMNEPTWGHVRKLKLSYKDITHDDVFPIVADLSGQAENILSRLSVKDGSALVEYVIDFL